MRTDLGPKLVDLVNNYINSDVYLDDYQITGAWINDESVLKKIKKVGKFRDIGSIYDYREILGINETYISILSLANNYRYLDRISISEKYNAIMYSTIDEYSIIIDILIDTENMEKFSKKVKKLLNSDKSMNVFRDVNFNCSKGEYIEISNTTNNKQRIIDTVRHKVEDENLVFVKDSVITNVLNDIVFFFETQTKELYKTLNIPYKRGIILYGDPGNGKSAMIRELIRILPEHINRIIINSGLDNFNYFFNELVKSQNGTDTLLILEDIDSIIKRVNRSELLNALDGVTEISNLFIIGTTNNPESIDPAFMNRAGRFDHSYKIENPTKEMRRSFFKSKDLGKILSGYQVYKNPTKGDKKKDIVELFVSHTDNMPMANLKEMITVVCYALLHDPKIPIEEALINAEKEIIENRAQHIKEYEESQELRRKRDVEVRRFD